MGTVSVAIHYDFSFLMNLAASAAKYCEKGAVNQSAASAASLDPILRLFELFGFS